MLRTTVRPFVLAVSYSHKHFIRFSETHCEHYAIGVDPTLVFSNSLLYKYQHGDNARLLV